MVKVVEPFRLFEKSPCEVSEGKSVVKVVQPFQFFTRALVKTKGFNDCTSHEFCAVKTTRALVTKKLFLTRALVTFPKGC